MNMEGSCPAPYAKLSPGLNRIPGNLRSIHLMGICGTGMASLAGILKEKGYEVKGSDQNVYPPMSDFLRKLGIPIREGYAPRNLHPRPDLVIVGNVITRLNPEALELARLGIPYLSFPQALKIFAIEEKRPIVVCGTHGKTTTSSMIAWLLERSGMDPGFMIGGIPLNFSTGFKLGKGPYFVVEGDEYDTAFFDKGPKFLHYAPWASVLTSIEFDHADIYRDLEHVLESFRKLIRILPSSGVIVANGDDPLVRAEVEKAPCRVITYGFGSDVDWRAVDVEVRENGTRFRILMDGDEYLRIKTPVYGDHNIHNLLSTVALSAFLGEAPAVTAEAALSFLGVKRRQEIRGEKGGVLVLDDFAHHPTAVRETLRAVREKYRGRRIVAVFEPRSNSSRRRVFQARYAESFNAADRVLIPEPPMMEKVPLQERFSSKKLVADLLQRGVQATYHPDTESLLRALLGGIKRGDVVLVMSNGSFDNLIDRLLKRMDNFPVPQR